MKNVKSTSGKGKVHKVVHADQYSGAVIEDSSTVHKDYGHRARWCDRWHKVDKHFTESFFLKWKRTDEPITCRTCLRAYYPDGRKRG